MAIEVKVGSQVTMGGQSYICTKIDTSTVTRYAAEDSSTMRQQYQDVSNTKHLSLELEDFDAMDIIDIEQQCVELTDPGRHMYFIYPYTRVKKAKEVEVKEDAITDRADA